jgi:hypothetical protein
VLQVSAGNWKEYLASQRGRPDARIGVPYSAVVHARSSVNLGAAVAQTSYVPGATLRLHAVLTEMDLPVDHRAQVAAEVKRPDGSMSLLTLSETNPGIFEASIIAAISGIYPVHFRAVGKTLRGYPFTREQLRTGMVWAGGDEPPPSDKPRDGACCPDWKSFFKCFLSEPSIRELLARYRIDPNEAAKCIEVLWK